MKKLNIFFIFCTVLSCCFLIAHVIIFQMDKAIIIASITLVLSSFFYCIVTATVAGEKVRISERKLHALEQCSDPAFKLADEITVRKVSLTDSEYMCLRDVNSQFTVFEHERIELPTSLINLVRHIRKHVLLQTVGTRED